MAITGLKKSFIAKYGKDTNGEYEYTEGTSFARMIDIDISAESNDAELYSDDELEESDYSFSSGSMKITTSGISEESTALIMGITPNPQNGSTNEMIYGANQPNELGFGTIIPKRVAGVDKFRAIILPRIKFKIPNDAAQTRQGKISFQNQALEAKIFRDFSENTAWKREATFTTETAAENYIKSFLSIT